MQHIDVLYLGMIIQTGPAAIFPITAVYFSVSHRKQRKGRNFWTVTPAPIKTPSRLKVI